MLAISTDRFFEAAGLIGYAALLFVLIMRRRASRFPVFTALVVYNIIQSTFLFGLSHIGSPRQQYFGFWWSTALGYALEVGFIFELALGIIRSTGLVTRQALMPFLSWSVFGGVVAAWIADVLTTRKSQGWDLWDMRATYFATCLTCFLYLAMLKVVNRWHLPWRMHVLKLGQGFAAWQLVSTLMDTLHVWLGWIWEDRIFDEVSKVMYLAVLMFWSVSLWFPEWDSHAKSSPESERLIMALAKKADTL